MPEGEEAEGEGEGRGRGRAIRRLRRGGVAPLSLSTGSAALKTRARPDPRRPAACWWSGWETRSDRYAATRHNLGFEVATELSRRWELPRARKRFRGLITEGRAGPGGPRVAVLLPQTFMNESGDVRGPGARQPSRSRSRAWSRCTTRSTCRSARCARSSAAASPATTGSRASPTGLGGPDFWRVRAGVGGPTRPTPRSSPPTCCPALPSRTSEVRELIGRAADEAERLVERDRGRGGRAVGARSSIERHQL